jgi:hypothetical protein
VDTKSLEKWGQVEVKGLPKDWQLRVDRYVWNIYGSHTASIPSRNMRHVAVGDVLWDREGDDWLRYDVTPVPWLAEGAGVPSADPASIDYYLTLMQPSTQISMPVSGGDVGLPGVGRCMSSLGGNDTVKFDCFNAEKMPTCFTLTLEKPEGVHMGEEIWCSPSYSPLPESNTHAPPPWPAFVHFNGPPEASMRLIVRIYEPVDHFKRHVIVPDFPAGRSRTF